MKTILVGFLSELVTNWIIGFDKIMSTFGIAMACLVCLVYLIKKRSEIK